MFFTIHYAILPSTPKTNSIKLEMFGLKRSNLSLLLGVCAACMHQENTLDVQLFLHVHFGSFNGL
jgi:hypothetical protein